MKSSLIIVALMLFRCSGANITTEADAGSTADAKVDSLYEAYVYNGCTETCDGICTCPPEYQACITTCGSHGVRYCLPAGAVNSEGCLAYGNEQCVNDQCVIPDAGTEQ